MRKNIFSKFPINSDIGFFYTQIGGGGIFQIPKIQKNFFFKIFKDFPYRVQNYSNSSSDESSYISPVGKFCLTHSSTEFSNSSD